MQHRLCRPLLPPQKFAAAGTRDDLVGVSAGRGCLAAEAASRLYAMKPEAISPSTARASRKRPAVASADPGPLEAKLSATRKGSFLPSVDPAVPPHTLLLGTQPSDNSLAHGQYFMTNANAFWHIVGGPAWSKCPRSQ